MSAAGHERLAKERLASVVKAAPRELQLALGERGMARMRGHVSKAREALLAAIGPMAIRYEGNERGYAKKLIEQIGTASGALGEEWAKGPSGERKDRLTFAMGQLDALADALARALYNLEAAEANAAEAKADAFPRDRMRNQRLEMQARTVATTLDLLDKLGREHASENPTAMHTLLVDAIPTARREGIVGCVDVGEAVREASVHVNNGKWGRAWLTLETIARAYEEAADAS